jgi:transposase InsO family protein
MYYWLNRNTVSYSLNSIYNAIGITKQGFAKQRKRNKSYKEEESYIINIVLQVRKDHPTMNCRDIYFKMNPVFVGRDRFEKICRENGLNVRKTKAYKRTTDSTGVIRFPNLLIDKTLSSMDEVWSSDITYFEINKEFYYITFILDNYTRRILGHQVSSRLLTQQTTIPALRMAIRERSKKLKKGIIFHSDGGGQYYADDFLAITKHYKFKNSMCEYAWENGKAERINGVIKNNYLKHWDIKTIGDLTKAVDRAVDLYNHDKPHSSLQRMTPVEFENKLLILDEQNQKSERVTHSKKRVNKGIEPSLTRAKSKEVLDVPKVN